MIVVVVVVVVGCAAVSAKKKKIPTKYQIIKIMLEVDLDPLSTIKMEECTIQWVYLSSIYSISSGMFLLLHCWIIQYLEATLQP